MIRESSSVESGPGYLIEEASAGQTLVVTGDWSEAAADVLASGEVQGLNLNYAKGYREHSLDFLREWPLRRLDVVARTIKDIEPIYRLSPTLRELSLTTAPTAVLDCARLPGLESVYVENWGQLQASLPLARRLRELLVFGGYAERDLLPLTDNGELEVIMLKQVTRLERLLGLEMLPRLSSLTVVGARNLTDLSSISALGQRARRLDLRSCKNLGGVEAVASLTGLEYFSIGNCGHIASLAPVAGMTGLVTLEAYESTRIDDGDLTPLLGLTRLRRLGLMNRRSYQPSVAEVKQHLGIEA